MVVLMVLLLALKLAQSGVHHTCDGGHDIVCSPPPPFCWVGGGGVVEPPTKFFKRWGGLTRSQFLEGSCWERGGELFQERLQFLHKK